MPFKFSFICDLLSAIESYETQDLPLSSAVKQKRQQDAIIAWFKRHADLLHSPSTNAVALLSSLFPERRTDRVYGIQESTLIRILARSLSLGTERLARLKSWRTSSSDDLATHVAKIQALTDAGTHFGEVTVEDVDLVLAQLAARCRFSSPAVREAHPAAPSLHPADLLRPLILQLSSRDLTWLIRILLKRLGPVNLPEQLVFRSFHFLLPDILKFHNTFDAAISLLNTPDFAFIPAQPDHKSQTALRKLLAFKVKPQLGVKIGRPEFYKARSINHCLQMAERGVWSMEPKYDGEYVQVHVDLSKGTDCIQIFSKSGKDSTKDREKLHKAIKLSLKLGQSDCPLRHGCILEGEMVVYSDKEERILDFHKIRKHVSRSGSFLGTERDSPAHAHEHLMIIYYDSFLIDDDAVMYQPYEERRRRLRRLITKYTGWVKTAEWTCLDISATKSRSLLERHFASAIAQRTEGLVLKSCAGPYFTLASDDNNSGAVVIKLKKDYIPGLGDSADFAVIGASYNASLAQQIDGPKLHWTTFFLACLENKEDVQRYQSRPVFRNVATISAAHGCISKQDALDLCAHGRFVTEEYQSDVEPTTFCLHPDSFSNNVPDVIFRTPVVVDVLGSAFEKPPSRGYYMLRHPRIARIQADRPASEAISFSELQELAHAANNVPADMVAEEAAWWQKLHVSQRETTSKESEASKTIEPPKTSDSQESSSGRETEDEDNGIESPPSSPIDSPKLRSEELLHGSSKITSCNGAGAHVDDPVSPSNITASRRPRTWPMIRVDSAEMQPGDARYVETLRHKHVKEMPSQVEYPKTFRVPTKMQDNSQGEMKSQKEKVDRHKISPSKVISFSTTTSLATPPSSAETQGSTSQKRQRDKGGALSPPRKTRIHNFTNTPASTQITPTSGGAKNQDRAALRNQVAHESPSVSYTELPKPVPRFSKLKPGPIQNVVIYIPPELQGWRWLNKHLLSHRALSLANITTITTLRHWIRDIDPNLMPLGPEVQESQAFPSLKKIVLVDRKMPLEAQKTITEVSKLAFLPTETIEFWDWRVLEDITTAMESWADDMIANLYDWSAADAGFSQSIDEALHRICILKCDGGQSRSSEEHHNSIEDISSDHTNSVHPTHRLSWQSKRRQEWFGFTQPELDLDWDLRLARHNANGGSFPSQLHPVPIESIEQNTT